MARIDGDARPNGRSLGWQFDALDLRPAERWLAALPLQAGELDGAVGSGSATTLTTLAGPPVRLVDRYLDTEDWRINRAGFVLRIRRHGRHVESTLRPISRRTPGGPCPSDIVQVLPDVDVADLAHLEELGNAGPVALRVGAVIGRRPLRRVLEVRTRRRPFVVRSAGEHVLDVFLDDTVIVISGGGRPVQLRRVQIRVPATTGAPALAFVRRLVDDLRAASGSRVASLSKFDAGLLAGGVTLPGPPDLGPLSLGPDATLGELAFATIRRQVVAITAHEPGTRLGEDPEELHDMRVATRRLRAALDLFVEVLPARARHLHAEVGWLASVLGEVRDLDVQLGRLGEMEQLVSNWADPADVGQPLDELRQLLEDARTARRSELLDGLDSARYERLVTELSTMSRQGPSRRSVAARAPALAAAPALIDDRHRAVTKAARRSARSGLAEDFHRLRIRCKRLRYTLEFTADLYGRRSDRFARRLAQLQDKLGLMQDAEVATAALLDAATDVDANLPALTIFAMGGIAERYREEAAGLLAGMPERLEILKSDEWRALAALMERRRLESLAENSSRTSPRSVTRASGSPPETEPAPLSATPERRTTSPATASRLTGPRSASRTSSQSTSAQAATAPDRVGTPEIVEANGTAPKPTPSNGHRGEDAHSELAGFPPSTHQDHVEEDASAGAAQPGTTG